MFYNAHLEYEGCPEPTAERTDAIMDALDGYHAALGHSPDGRLSVRITFPAESLEQASRTAFAVIGHALNTAAGARAGFAPIVAEIMTEEEFDLRESFEHVPELIGSAETAGILGISEQRVRQMIEEGKFRSVQRIGQRGLALARSEVVARVSSNAVAVDTDRRVGESNEEWIERITPV